MPLITLLTDWESSNTYLPQVMGSIYTGLPTANVVSISPPVKAHQVARAGYILKHSLSTFPEGTLHAIFVGMPVDFSKVLIATIGSQRVITWDTGLISLLSDDKISVHTFEYTTQPDENNWLTPMAKAIIKAGKEEPIERWTNPTADYIQLRNVQPILQRNQILGNVIHIDPYGNAITNITKDWFDTVSKGRKFELYVQSNFNKIARINADYEPHRIGELLALFNAQGHMEIAIAHGNVAELLNLNTSSEIRVRFINTIETV